MATVKLPDGQSFDFPDDIAGDDKLLRDSLISFVPEIGNAELRRATVAGLMTVTVVKKSGTKGAASITDLLAAAPEKLNPAVLMQQRLQQAEAVGKLSVAELLLMSGEIEKAIKAGGDEISRVGAAFNVLKNADAQTAKTTPIGF